MRGCPDVANRSIAVFDELKQSVSEIDSLGDPTTGEVRVACPLAVASTLIPPAFESFVEKYPRAVVHFDEVTAASMTRNFQELRERQYDLIPERWSPTVADRAVDNDIHTCRAGYLPRASTRPSRGRRPVWPPHLSGGERHSGGGDPAPGAHPQGH
jgi:DNA-binding transcriptional LysR family regulator